MRRHLQVYGCLAAWLFATGCQWDLMQVIAWGRMFTGYAQTMSLTAATQETFSGEMCSLCKVVQKGKEQQEKSTPPTTELGKAKLLDTLLPSATVMPMAPTRRPLGVVLAPPGLVGRGRMPPPLPPPRAVA